jgi:hypothetical protein
MGSLLSGRSLYHASFGFFLIVLRKTRIVFHVMLKEMQKSMLPVVFLRSSVSNIQENHGSSGANGGWTIISAKTTICQKPRKVIACPLNSVIAIMNHMVLYSIWLTLSDSECNKYDIDLVQSIVCTVWCWDLHVESTFNESNKSVFKMNPGSLLDLNGFTVCSLLIPFIPAR